MKATTYMICADIKRLAEIAQDYLGFLKELEEDMKKYGSPVSDMRGFPFFYKNLEIATSCVNNIKPLLKELEDGCTYTKKEQQ